MARKAATTAVLDPNEVDPTEVEVPETDPTLDPAVDPETGEPETVEPSVPVTPAEPVEAPEAKPDEKPVDLTAFEAALDAILAPHRAAEAAGEATSGKPDEELVPALIEAYTALDGAGAKRKARNLVAEIGETAMREDHFFTAKCAMILGNEKLVAAKAAKAAKEPKAPVDPTGDFINHLLTLNLAYQYAVANPPAGIAVEWPNTYTEQLEKLQVEVPDISEDNQPAEGSILARAVKVGTQKASKKTTRASSGPRVGVYSGPPRSIATHIKETFAAQPVGTFLKIGEISKFESQEYGSDNPSPGAISGQVKKADFSQLYPGLVAILDGVKGVRKDA